MASDVVRSEWADHHMYLSPACWHALERMKLDKDYNRTEEFDVAAFDSELHKRCRKACEFCGTSCLCECHEVSDSTTQTTE